MSVSKYLEKLRVLRLFGGVSLHVDMMTHKIILRHAIDRQRHYFGRKKTLPH
jgi:hypothetical protein